MEPIEKKDLSERGLGATMGVDPFAGGNKRAYPEIVSEERIEQEISYLFTYQPPRHDQIPRYNDVRLAARMLATVIYRTCPNGPDRSAAIRKLRECVMTANAAIALS